MSTYRENLEIARKHNISVRMLIVAKQVQDRLDESGKTMNDSQFEEACVIVNCVCKRSSEMNVDAAVNALFDIINESGKKLAEIELEDITTDEVFDKATYYL